VTFKGIMGIRFAKHQRCYIRAQTKELPKLDSKTIDIEVFLISLNISLRNLLP